MMVTTVQVWLSHLILKALTKYFRMPVHVDCMRMPNVSRESPTNNKYCFLYYVINKM